MCENTEKRVEIDLNGVQNAREFHEILKEKLGGFPDCYGYNWDAFWDVITGMIELPELLVIFGWKHINEILPEDARIFRSCLRMANARVIYKDT